MDEPVLLTPDELRRMMDEPNNIRNLSVIASIDHGKSSLIDQLLAAAGIILRNEFELRFTEVRYDSAERRTSIRPGSWPLHFKLPQESIQRSFLINLFDSSSHLDSSHQLATSLRVSDGALVVIDVIEGALTPPINLLRQALIECITPILTLNKLDRAFSELQIEHEQLYQTCFHIIDATNNIIDTYSDVDSQGKTLLSVTKGTVAFSSGLQGWGFTLSKFARMYAIKFGIDEAKMIDRLWGDSYYDSANKKWTSNPISSSGDHLPRGFCKFILEPISEICNACMQNDMEKLDKCLSFIGIELTSQDRYNFQEKRLFKCIMQKWLPISDAILSMIVHHIPSPIQAQDHRVQNLYTGPMDDDTAKSIKNCDPTGPLVMYISKMLPSSNRGRFYAFGRVFSGTITTGQKIRILGSKYEFGRMEDVVIKSAVRLEIPMGRFLESVESVPAGNICTVFGIDAYILGTATLTSDEHSHPITSIKISLHPIVEVWVEAKDPKDLPKLIEGLRQLNKIDSLVQIRSDEIGLQMLSGAGDRHLRSCISQLGEIVNAPITASDPVVRFRETVISESSHVCMTKSPNKHNRIYVTAVPLADGLADAIESGIISPKDDPQVRSQVLSEKFDWDLIEAKKIWSFGPDDSGANLCVDVSDGVRYLNEIKDSVCAAFQWTTSEGVLVGEKMRGIRFNIHDVVLHADAIHRGGGQIIPTVRRALYAAQLSCETRLMEPIYLVEALCRPNDVETIINIINMRTGEIIDQIQKRNSIVNVIARLPVAESMGFQDQVQTETLGHVFPQCVFDHWKIMPGDPWQEGDMQFQTVCEIRKRRGLSPDLPILSKYEDTL
eukprot:TRINITY_DN3363_c0_g2_i1.p1 TRINITY_DN3363_c0_g2~~TRINITY_DN3363_c0_g2_i1.p1  ORF type:complete len:837 (-),score=182.72 TRINITY_DN3363_c0_g2_i1:78-2588(-)